MVINFENYYDIQEKLKEALTNKEPRIMINNVHWALINEVLDDMGFIELDVETNGWQYDRWSKIWISGSDYYYEVYCSCYYPDTKFELVTDPELVNIFKSMYDY